MINFEGIYFSAYDKNMKHALKIWIEAMRLRTLPVSATSVVAASALAVLHDCFRWAPAAICLVFALTAQIASNFANEYFDYRAGLDRPGRVGPRRGVTEGDISPRAMLAATLVAVAIACLFGLWLVVYGGCILIPVGIFIVLGLFAYSAGPYPLSRHALGEPAVVLFFGVIPVSACYYIMSGTVTSQVLLASVGIGLMGANILIVNNYRDYDDDKAVGKHTLATLFGRRVSAWIYLINGYMAMFLMWPVWDGLSVWYLMAPAIYLAFHGDLWWCLRRRSGSQLNPLLGKTALNMFLFSLILLLQFALI